MRGLNLFVQLQEQVNTNMDKQPISQQYQQKVTMVNLKK